MANRHKVQAKAKGGGITGIHGGGSAHDGTAPRKDPVKLAYTGQGSNVEKESRQRKQGGRVEHKASGGAAKPRLDKKARGGKVHTPHTPGVKASGKDMTSSPFSAAHVVPHHSDGGNPEPHHLKHVGPHRAKPGDSKQKGYARGGHVKHGSHSHHDGHHHSAVHIHHHKKGGPAGK